ncbi:MULTISPECIES: O-antigen ligase family protein [Mesorhizobium]|uniref:O-antigen ligase family protein n=1 Tax=Mesorhizobium denitrificans TaxID=2294114 RepID=A0A371XHV8_9HYPH|nr:MULTISPECIES: O-antigen ligase family protein [Mesorhizobium]RFC68818.1 O-antigen ligase family protein [Mesorhizobium denitrificans]
MKQITGLLADKPRVNRVFTLLCFAAPPAAGSVVSFLFNGGGLACFANVLTGRVALSKLRDVRIISLLFLGYVACCLLAALMNGSAFRKPTELLSLATFAFFPFSYAYWSISVKKDVISSIVWGSAIACVSGLAVAVAQAVMHPGIRVEGGAGNALVFATVTVIAISVVLAGIMLGGNSRRPILGGFAFCGVLALVLSQSRSPLLMLAVNALMLMIVFGGARWLRRLWLPVTAVVLLLAAMLASGVDLPFISPRFHEVITNWKQVRDQGNYDSSAGLRLAIWEIGFEMWKEAPWFGHGRQFAAEEMGRRLVEIYGIDRSFTHFHNFLLQALVQNGVLGLLSLLALLGFGGWLAFKTLKTSQDDERRFGAALMLIVLVTYIGAGITNIMFGHDILDAVFMICMVPGVYLAVGRSMAVP